MRGVFARKVSKFGNFRKFGQISGLKNPFLFVPVAALEAATGGARNIKSIPMPYFRWGTINLGAAQALPGPNLPRPWFVPHWNSRTLRLTNTNTNGLANIMFALSVVRIN